MNHPRKTLLRKSNGFTLVELLVVITIIGILIALLLPAVQAAREAARRMQCANNMKQIGLAMHMHLEAKQVFPYGHYWSKSGVGGRESTWVVYLFPYLDAGNLYDTIDWTLPFGCAANDPPWNLAANKTQLATFVCPSNAPIEPIGANAAGEKCYARGSYAANNGLGPMAELTIDALPITRSRLVSNGGSTVRVTGRQLCGAFYLNSEMTAADFPDGLSNTAFLSEVIAVPGEDMRGMITYPEGCFYHHNYTPNSTTPDGIRNGYCVSANNAPCTSAFTFDGAVPASGSRRLTMTARSEHPGGVQLTLGDGSVRFVSDSIDLDTWRALSTPKALPGEGVSLDF